MAKKNQVYIDVVIDDKGTTKRVAVNAKKLGMELDKAGAGTERAAKGQNKLNKSSKDLDRNMRGTAKMTSNSSKEFSKMQQGMGGLVGAYATLAAQVFAVSAAFQFLQTASDLRNLISGQEALGAVSGTAYKTITNSIIEATDAQIKYADAAKAAAIGTAAGLGAGQLERLGVAAKNTSFALGRDLTDSFNRLVRGVTKAEPELLDELGIILRLEPATKKYALAIGKTAEELDAFERTQAVTNEVLTQAEDKFGNLERFMDEDAATLARFTKSFDDLINTMKIGIIDILTPALKFLSQNTMALVASLGLFALPIIKAIIPSMTLWAKESKSNAKLQRRLSRQYRQQVEKDTIAAKEAFADREKAALASNQKTEKILKGTSTKSAGLAFLRGGRDTASSRRAAKKILDNALDQLKHSKVVETGYLKGMERKQLKNLEKSYNKRVEYIQETGVKTREVWKGITHSTNVMTGKVRAMWASTMAFMSKAAQGAARVINVAFTLTAIFGVVTLIIEAGKALKEFFFPLSEEMKRQKEITEELSEKYKTLGEEMGRAADARDKWLTGMESISSIGKQVGSANILGIFDDLRQLSTLSTTTKEYAELSKNVGNAIDELIRADKRFVKIKEVMQGTREATKELRAEMINLGNDLMQSGARVDTLQRSLAEVQRTTEEFNKKGIKTTPLTTVVQASRQAYQDHLGVLSDLIVKSGEFSDKAYEAADNIKRITAFQKEAQAGLTNLQASPQGIALSKGYTLGDATSHRQDVAAQIKLIEKLKVEEAEAYKEAENRVKLATDTNKQMEEIGDEAQKLSDTYEMLNAHEQKLLKNIKDRNEMMQKARELQSAVPTIGAKINNLELKRASILKKIGEAEDKYSSALILRETATTEVAKRQADVQVVIAKARLDSEIEVGRVKEEGLQLTEEELMQQRLINIAMLARARIAASEAASKRKLRREEFLGGGTRGSLIEQRRLEDERLSQRLASAEIESEKAAEVYERNFALVSKMERERLEKLDDYKPGGRYEGKAFTHSRANVEADMAPMEQRKVTAAATIADLEQQIELRGKAGEAYFATLDAEKEGLEIQRSMVGLLNSNVKLRQLEANYFKATGRVAEGEDLTKLKLVAKELEEQEFLLQSQIQLADGFRQGLEGAFGAIIDGSKSAKQAFADMARSMLQMMAQIIAKMLVMKMMDAIMPGIGGLFGGGSAATSSSTAATPTAKPNPFWQGRYGGIAENPKNYAGGGIARGRDAGYPAILHGTEAVVPLPNNKSIPVDLGGGAGQQNIVTVNVSMDNSGNSSDSSSNNQMGANIGKVVAQAVQEELQYQKRSGGILNPYGVA